MIFIEENTPSFEEPIFELKSNLGSENKIHIGDLKFLRLRP